MKAKAYVRVAKGGSRKGYKIEVSTSPKVSPLYDSKDDALATVAFALDLNIPDSLFKQAEAVVAEINITKKQAIIVAEVEAV